jgi:transposase
MSQRVYYVGVDMAQANFEASLWRQEPAEGLGRYENQTAGFEGLKQALTQRTEPEGVIHLIVEPTGGYELGLVSYGLEQGWLVSLPNPKQVRDWAKSQGRRAKTDKLDSLVLAAYGAKQKLHLYQPAPVAVEQLDDLLHRQQDLQQMLGQERNRLHALQVRPEVAPYVLQSVKRHIELIEKELAELEQVINDLLDQNPELKQHRRRLQSVPGVGPKNSLVLLVLLARWQALTQGQGSAKALTAYVGLDPTPYESGSSVYRRATISKMGNTQLRSQLYLGALGGVRGHNPLRDFYGQLVSRGKAKKLALVASARKILIWSWAVFSQQLDFDPKKVNPAFV